MFDEGEINDEEGLIVNEWLNSSKPFNYVIAARLYFYSYHRSKAIINEFSSRIFVGLNKLIAEGFSDANPFYEKLLKMLTESELKEAHDLLRKYRSKYSDSEWKIQKCVTLCNTK